MKSGRIERDCRNLVATRAGNACERCGGGSYGYNLSFHHRKKRSQGGEWTAANIVLVCGSGTTGCHGWIEHNPNDAEWDGFHVRPWQDPAAEVVKYRGEWAVLTPDGKIEYAEHRRELAPDDGDVSQDGREGLAPAVPPSDQGQ